MVAADGIHLTVAELGQKLTPLICATFLDEAWIGKCLGRMGIVCRTAWHGTAAP